MNYEQKHKLANKLIDAGRQITLPLEIALLGNQTKLICENAIRILPKKRFVFFGHWGNKPVVIKIFLDKDQGFSLCKKEEKGSRALQYFNIKTPNLLYIGFVNDLSTSILIYEKLTDARNLDDVWRSLPDRNNKQLFLHKLMTLFAQHHNSGIYQQDCHLNNFLYQNNEIYSIDCGALNTNAIGKKLSRRNSINNLALLFVQLQNLEQDLFSQALSTYFAAREWKTSSKLLNQFQRRYQKLKKYHLKKILAKTLRECTDYAVVRQENILAICKREFKNLLINILQSPEKKLHDNLAMICYETKGILPTLKNFFTGNQAKRLWIESHRQQLTGKENPKPIAFFSKKLGLFHQEHYFISENRQVTK